MADRYAPSDPADARHFLRTALASGGWGLDGATLADLYKQTDAVLAPYLKPKATVAGPPALPGPAMTVSGVEVLDAPAPREVTPEFLAWFAAEMDACEAALLAHRPIQESQAADDQGGQRRDEDERRPDDRGDDQGEGGEFGEAK